MILKLQKKLKKKGGSKISINQDPWMRVFGFHGGSEKLCSKRLQMEWF